MGLSSHIGLEFGHAASAPVFPSSESKIDQAGLAQVTRYAAALGTAPVVIAGDLNDEPATSPVLAASLASGHWHDAAILEADKTEPPTPPAPTTTSLYSVMPGFSLQNPHVT